MNENVEVEVAKDGEKVNETLHLTNLKKEIINATKQLEEIDLRLDLLKEEKKIVCDNHKIIMSKFKLLKFTWDFESDKEYIENTKKLNDITLKKKVLDYDTQIERMINLSNQVQLQISGLQKEVDRIEGGKDE